MDNTPLTTLLLGEVRAEMARQRVTQATLSQATGVPVSTISRRLSGKSPLTLTDADEMARALGTDLLTLMTRVQAGAA